ncbi:putative zinc finger protein [Tamaricihabitans halophyticus]|uniref:Putative zinc finger protein n=1 Tax=Tamaricihabitans halophyticus TaxID=1262583 RepID=A0A4R2R3L7_9PSEU|nr:zf-HC2 domain-containing protein [Tamaricihabitans halophyticus]TCP56218.1 putative zinc finger protein [Tamaricihabitans halophyticus]
MTELRGWSLPQTHLLPDAIVAFVDGELSPSAQDRASAHVAGCPACAAEVRAQRQASGAVRGAAAPMMSPDFLANLCAIPQREEVPSSPDGLAVAEDGQLVAVQRPGALGSGQPLGSGAASLGSAPLGSSPMGSSPMGSSAPLGTSGMSPADGAFSARRVARRGSQGAGVVVSGLVLGALALVTTSAEVGGQGGDPTASLRPAITGGVEMLQAAFSEVP